MKAPSGFNGRVAGGIEGVVKLSAVEDQSV